MGFDKAFLQLDGVSLLAGRTRQLLSLFEEVMLVCENRTKLTDMAPNTARIVEDLFPGTGPLGAVCTALLETQRPFVFVSACDMPRLDEGLLLDLWKHADNVDIALCTHEERDEPLFAFYHRRCLPVFEKQLEKGDFRLKSGFSQLCVSRFFVDENRARHAFANLNTPQELACFSKTGIEAQNPFNARDTEPYKTQDGGHDAGKQDS